MESINYIFKPWRIHKLLIKKLISVSASSPAPHSLAETRRTVRKNSCQQYAPSLNLDSAQQPQWTYMKTNAKPRYRAAVWVFPPLDPSPFSKGFRTALTVIEPRTGKAYEAVFQSADLSTHLCTKTRKYYTIMLNTWTFLSRIWVR